MKNHTSWRNEPEGRHLKDTDLFEACKQFLTDKKATAEAIAEYLRSRGYKWMTREKVYPLIREGVRAGFVRLCPPEDRGLSDRLQAMLGVDVTVVDVRGENVNGFLAQETARKILTLIQVLRESKSEVHIGIGSGYTSEIVCRELAKLLSAESDSELPKLAFHAINMGYEPDSPASSPVTFFGYFRALQRENMRFVGLFCPARVRVEKYEALKEEADLAAAFEQAGDIDIVFTSFAASQHEHSQFQRLSEMKDNVTLNNLNKQHWVGDVQLRPYNKQGPITREKGFRTITLFEIEDFRRMARQRQKHVILVAGPCHICKMSKAPALRPLLDVEALRVFNHLVIDTVTAHEVLAIPALDDSTQK